MRQADQIASMEADMKVVGLAVTGFLSALGIDFNDPEVQKDNIIRKLPSLAAKLSTGITSGTLSKQLADLEALGPVIEKYKYLYKDDSNE